MDSRIRRLSSNAKLTLIVTYYNDIKFIRKWYDLAVEINDKRPDSVHLIVVDDGSQQKPASLFLEPLQQPFINLFCVTEDVGFNSHGSRNLAMHHTPTQWNLMSDVDREVDADTVLGIIDEIEGGEVRRGNFYQFSNAHNKEHSLNEYVVHYEDFWEAGGYDEEFCNVHWGDRLFLQCLSFIARPVVKPWILKYTRGARKVTTENVERTQYPDDSTLIMPAFWANQKLRTGLVDYVSERNKIPYQRKRKPVLNFPWERVI